MLYLNDSRSTYRIMAIDPGTNSIGVSILDLDLLTFKINLIWSDTFHPDKSLKYMSTYVSRHGDLDAKLQVIEDLLLDLMLDYDVDDIVSESPYMGRFAAAFGALTKCLGAIDKAVRNYDYTLDLYLIDPSTVKSNVGVSGKSGDKNLVKQAVLMLPFININNINLHYLDEHSIDSIAVGYGFLMAKIK